LLKLNGWYSPKGIYEYVIARTKYIDQVFKTAIEDRYFKNKEGEIIAGVNGTHCIVLAQKR